MKKLHWLKRTAILTDTQMMYLLSCGDAYVVIWYLLQDVAAQIQDNGRIYMTPSRPMDTAFLASLIRRRKGQVEKALDLFESIDLIARDDEVVITLLVWDELQDLARLERQRQQNRERQSRYRERHREETTAACAYTQDDTAAEAIPVTDEENAGTGAARHYRDLWGHVSAMQADMLRRWERQWGTEAVCTAIDIGRDNGTNHMKYIEAVLTHADGRPKRRETARERWKREVDQCLAELFPENREPGREQGKDGVREGRTAAHERQREPGAARTLAQAMPL